MYRLSGDREVMGEQASSPVGRIAAAVAMALITACVIALGVVAVL